MGRRLQLYCSCRLLLLDSRLRHHTTRRYKITQCQAVGKISTCWRVSAHHVRSTCEVSRNYVLFMFLTVLSQKLCFHLGSSQLGQRSKGVGGGWSFQCICWERLEVSLWIHFSVFWKALVVIKCAMFFDFLNAAKHGRMHSRSGTCWLTQRNHFCCIQLTTQEKMAMSPILRHLPSLLHATQV